MGELKEEYGDRIDFVIVSAEETAQRMDEIEEYGFSAQKHGLVAFDAEGQPAVKIPGHQFGRPEIESAIQQLLGP